MQRNYMTCNDTTRGGAGIPAQVYPPPLHQLHTPPHCTLSARPDCVCDCALMCARAAGKLRRQAATLHTAPTVTLTPSPHALPKS